MKVSIASLRAECPEWSFTSERYGFGWRYVGRRDGQVVTIYAVARIVGEWGDEFETEWLVDDGKTSHGYVHWWLKQYGDSKEGLRQ